MANSAMSATSSDFRTSLMSHQETIKTLGANFVLPDFLGVHHQLDYAKARALIDSVLQRCQLSVKAFEDFLLTYHPPPGDDGGNPNDDSEDYTEDLNAWIASHPNTDVKPTDPAAVEDANDGIDDKEMNDAKRIPQQK